MIWYLDNCQSYALHCHLGEETNRAEFAPSFRSDTDSHHLAMVHAHAHAHAFQFWHTANNSICMQLITFYYIWKLALDFNVYKMWCKNGFRTQSLHFMDFVGFLSTLMRMLYHFGCCLTACILSELRKFVLFHKHSIRTHMVSTSRSQSNSSGEYIWC